MGRFDDLQLTATRLGRDHLLVITGGSAHIGATSTAYLTGGNSCTQTSVVPGHKEHVLTEGLALKASKQLGNTVTVIMGIHYDDLLPSEIQEISSITEKMVDDYIASLESKQFLL